jgi:hypothetical protein
VSQIAFFFELIMKDELKVNQIKYLWHLYDIIDRIEIYAIRPHRCWICFDFQARNLNIDFTRRGNYKSYEQRY